MSSLDKRILLNIRKLKFGFKIHIGLFSNCILFFFALNLVILMLPLWFFFGIAGGWAALMSLDRFRIARRISKLKKKGEIVAEIGKKNAPDIPKEFIDLSPIPTESLKPNQSELTSIPGVSPKKSKSSKDVKEKPLTQEELMELVKTESELDIEQKEFTCIVHKGKIRGNNIYLCPNCRTFYCVKCARTLKERHENCWSCKAEFILDAV